MVVLAATLVTGNTQAAADYPDYFDGNDGFTDGYGGSSGTGGGLSGGAPAGAPKGSYDRVVTMGDSYAAGVGSHKDDTGYDDHGPAWHFTDERTTLGVSTCKREVHTNHGGLAAARLGVPHQMVACGGAEVPHVHNQMRHLTIPGSGDGTLIALTVGGNDIRTFDGSTWGELFARCIKTGFFTTQDVCLDTPFNEIVNFPSINADLRNLYTSIISRYPDATIRVMLYPEIMQPNWQCSVVGISARTARWIDGETRVLNATVQSAVSAVSNSTGADIRTVSVEEEFDGRGTCRSKKDSYINGITFGKSVWREHHVGSSGHEWVTMYSKGGKKTGAAFHPTPRGYQGFFDSLWPTI